MKMSRCFLSPLVVFLFVLALSSQSSPAIAAGKSGKGQETVSKVVEINKQALGQLQAGKYEAARDALWGAISVLNDANMADHEICARTHVHLAAVYMTGFNDRTKAIRQFVMAFKINPNIKITPQVETAALDEAYDAARSQANLAPAARTTAAAGASGGKPPAGTGASASAPAVDEHATSETSAGGPSPATTTGGRRGSRGTRRFVDVEEPPPPARIPEPLYCPLPSEVPPKHDILVRCTTQKQPRRATGTLFYRESGAEEEFTPLPMTRSPKGWLTATVPATAVTGNAFQFYIEAKVPGAKEELTIGSSDGPNLMPIVDGAAPLNNSALVLLLEGKDTSTRTEPMAEDKAPLEEINQQYQMDEDLRKYHRRLAGSVFLSVGGGTGSTYHGPVNLDSHDIGVDAKILHVGAGYSLATLFQLVPEIGYQFSDRFAMSLQARYQYTPPDSTGWIPKPGVKAPPTSALAFFLRGQYAFFTGGNFQFFASGVAGGGQRAFLGYVAKKCTQTLARICPAGTDHSDTISGGPVAVGAGVGIMYHLTRWLALWVEGRGMSSVAPIIVLGEFNGGLAFAHKFEAAGPPPPKEEGGGWERPPEQAEAPPADAPSSE
jgi:hypothetical protein